ncbi:hypothetical protein LTR35_017712, partial [Friedmanniomyces endolithicus]
MSSQEWASQLRLQDNSVLEKVLETLQVMQKAEPNRFRSSKLKIQKKGQHDQSRIKNFTSHSGPDLMTRAVLEGNAVKWMQNPLAFWSHPGQYLENASSISPPARLVEAYISAHCDDASSRMVQRIACIVLVEIRDWMGRPAIDDITDSVHVAQIVNVPEVDIKKIV